MNKLMACVLLFFVVNCYAELPVVDMQNMALQIKNNYELVQNNVMKARQLVYDIKMYYETINIVKNQVQGLSNDAKMLSKLGNGGIESLLDKFAELDGLVNYTGILINKINSMEKTFTKYYPKYNVAQVIGTPMMSNTHHLLEDTKYEIETALRTTKGIPSSVNTGIKENKRIMERAMRADGPTAVGQANAQLLALNNLNIESIKLLNAQILRQITLQNTQESIRKAQVIKDHQDMMVGFGKRSYTKELTNLPKLH